MSCSGWCRDTSATRPSKLSNLRNNWEFDVVQIAGNHAPCFVTLLVFDRVGVEILSLRGYTARTTRVVDKVKLLVCARDLVRVNVRHQWTQDGSYSCKINTTACSLKRGKHNINNCLIIHDVRLVSASTDCTFWDCDVPRTSVRIHWKLGNQCIESSNLFPSLLP